MGGWVGGGGVVVGCGGGGGGGAMRGVDCSLDQLTHPPAALCCHPASSLPSPCCCLSRTPVPTARLPARPPAFSPPQAGGKVRPDLEAPFASLREAARKVAKVGRLRRLKGTCDVQAVGCKGGPFAQATGYM